MNLARAGSKFQSAPVREHHGSNVTKWLPADITLPATTRYLSGVTITFTGTMTGNDIDLAQVGSPPGHISRTVVRFNA